jgi:hypothetical protein
MRARDVVGLLVSLGTATTLLAGCANPPDKEMQQAQGALDAARASGAEQYAADDYQAAATMLKQSQDAVAQRDYRLALNHALESRERAQTAAKTAADQKAVVRSEAEQLLRDALAAIAEGRERIKEAGSARTTPSAGGAQQALDAAEIAVQEARAALDGRDYLGARERLSGHADRIRRALQELAAGQLARPGRRRR